MKIFLIRHGESTGDIEDRFGGDYDDHLTERGRAQATALADSLAGKGIEKLYVSPRHRARETGDIVGTALGLIPEIVNTLRERNAYGQLTGLVKSAARAQFPEVVAQLTDPTATITGAEPYDQFVARVSTTMTELTNTNLSVIAILTHGGFIRAFYRSVLEMGELAELGDCTVREIEKNRGEFLPLN